MTFKQVNKFKVFVLQHAQKRYLHGICETAT